MSHDKSMVKVGHSAGMIQPSIPLGPEGDAAKAALGEKWPLQTNLNGTNGTPVILTRASQEINQDVYGKWRAYTDDVPAFGVGLSLEGESTNKCTNFNFAPDAALTNVTGTALGVTSRVLDAEGLSAAGFQPLIDDLVSNSYVYHIDNTGGGARVSLNIGGVSGNTNQHVLSAFTRGNGSIHYATQYGSDKTVFSSLSYDRVVHTPAVGSSQPLVISVEAGEECWFFGNQLEESQIVTSPIAVEGSSATRALDDAQVSTTGFPVNDCAYYIELPRGITDNGATQIILASYVDASNFTRIYYLNTSGNIVVQKRVGGVNIFLTASYSGDGTPFSALFTQDSVSGLTLDLSTGISATPNADTADIAIGSIIQLGATTFLVNPLFSEEAIFKYFNTSDITLEAAANA